MSANELQKKMKMAKLPMTGRYLRAFFSPMTPTATEKMASASISNRLRSVSLAGGTSAASPPRATTRANASAPASTNKSTSSASNTCVSEKAVANCCVAAWRSRYGRANSCRFFTPGRRSNQVVSSPMSLLVVRRVVGRCQLMAQRHDQDRHRQDADADDERHRRHVQV